ncbi:prepilin-type N-terminal cleavage/methylation domain-containing protein [Akkermansia glycaniphila]|uniref:Bacterial general secretion pathway protein g signature n=1 Tax=Akkermansia glycaniphila TaxID=1679444 RepID=A0A1H6KMD3_9BACT|nr:prepilin-type N-terminal cleavage/methylation domain-containing protein [Akkermansia glycaniphila]SEH72717.1 bacterial general secretion pathway protein g signature [Akkermansia glycaniphila]
MTYHRHIRLHRGFTLIEILIVIAIIAILMTIGMFAFNAIKEKKRAETVKVTISALSTALDQYRSDNSCYPVGDGSETSSTKLYEALYRDEDGDGRPDMNPEGQGRLKPYWDKLKPGSSDPESVNVKRRNGRYVILDPWGTPYRYRLGSGQNAVDADGNRGNGINADFDIWSLGPDMKGNNGPNKTGDNEDNICNW